MDLLHHAFMPMSWYFSPFTFIEYLIQHINVHLSFSFQLPLVEYLSINNVPDWKMSITDLNGFNEYCK